MAKPDQSTIEEWQQEAWKLFGYYLGSYQNQHAVACAMMQIDQILRDNRDVEIVVRALREAGAEMKRLPPPEPIHLPG